VLRFDSFFAAAEIGGFSPVFEFFQLRPLNLVVRRIGLGFGGYGDASQDGDLVRFMLGFG
jgi:hypothetical protein